MKNTKLQSSANENLKDTSETSSTSQNEKNIGETKKIETSKTKGNKNVSTPTFATSENIKTKKSEAKKTENVKPTKKTKSSNNSFENIETEKSENIASLNSEQSNIADETSKNSNKTASSKITKNTSKLTKSTDKTSETSNKLVENTTDVTLSTIDKTNNLNKPTDETSDETTDETTEPKFDPFNDLKSKNQAKTSVVLPYVIALSPLISTFLLSVFYLITGEEIALFHLNFLQLLLIPLVIFICFLPFDIYYIIKKEWKPFKVLTKHIFKNRLECALMIGSFIWMIFASFFAPNFPTDFSLTIDLGRATYLQECIIFILAYLIILISSISLKDKNIMEHIVGVFLTCTTIICITTLIFHHKELIISFGNNTNWANAFVNSNHLGYVLCLATSLLAVCFCVSTKAKHRIVFGIVLALHLFVCMFNDTLGSNLSLTFGFILLPIIFSLRNRKLDILSFVPLVSLLAISFICIPLSKPMDSTYSNLCKQIVGVFKDFFKISTDPLAEETKKAGTNRWELWLDAFKQIKEYPIFGDGDFLTKPHNEYLQFAAHSGILSAVLYIAGLVILAVKGIKHFKHISKLSLVLLFSVMCYAISAFFGNTMPHTYPFFLIILGFCISSLNQDVDNYKKQNRTTQGMGKTFGFNENNLENSDTKNDAVNI